MAGKRYRYVAEGDGHVFDFNDTSRGEKDGGFRGDPPIYLVGTYGCRTCIGLYIKINDTKCLMAHINGVDGRKWTIGVSATKNRIVDPAQGRILQEAVLQKLKDTAEREKWTPTGREQVVWCCLYHKAFDGDTLFVGHYLVKAIQKFLLLPDQEMPMGWEGFIVDHKTGRAVAHASYRRELFRDKDQPKDLDGFEAQSEWSVRDWVFKV